MRAYLMNTAYDADGNSPWDTLWYEGDDWDLLPLKGELPLTGIWKPISVTMQKRLKVPDIYTFQLFFAASKRVRDVLKPVLGDSVEFLRLRCDRELYVMHSLQRIELDWQAVAGRTRFRDNVTVIKKYVFARGQSLAHLRMFYARQPEGTEARAAGLCCSGLLVTEPVKVVCDTHKLRGICFTEVGRVK